MNDEDRIAGFIQAFNTAQGSDSVAQSIAFDALLHPAPTRNGLLGALDARELGKLAPWLEIFPLELGAVVYHPHVHIEHVYFPTSGSISTIHVSGDGELEISSVGREGFAGISSLLHAGSVPTRAVVQAKGSAYRVEVAVFREVVGESASMHRLFSRYILATINQLSQAAACNRLHSLEARCARWLLMAHDRADGDHISLTQHGLSYLLGVHRPAVTLVALAFHKAGLIEYSRGKIVILDRAGLESAACSCYETSRQDLEMLLSSPA